jgi:hypothetical protein
MLKKDRDRIVQLSVFKYFLDEWFLDDETEINSKDRNKIRICLLNINSMLDSFIKQEGKAVFRVIAEEVKNCNFAVLDKDEKVSEEGYENNILKMAIKKVIENSTQCELCNRTDHKYCEWYVINKFIGSEQVNEKKKQCPYRKSLDNIFDLGDDDL